MVYQKDLGPDTDRLATSLAVFDPDETWTVVSSDETTPPSG